jgi:uncharacterized protein (TIGR00730 family)
MPPGGENDPKKKSSVISLADENGVREVVVETVLGLWDVVNNLTRLRPSRRERYRVTIFGSARVPRDSLVYNEVKRLARALTDLGCDIVSGGGPGLMQAANEGASEAGSKDAKRSLGIRVDLPFEQESNPFVEEVFELRTFFTRLHQFVLMSDAFVVVPGGVGTVLETLMIWQLLQVKHIERTPLILIGAMWKDLTGWARRHMIELHPELPLAKAEDMEIPICLKSADEAIAVLRERHAEWLREQGR